MLPDETQEAEPEKTGTASKTTSVPTNGPNTNELGGVIMNNKRMPELLQGEREELPTRRAFRLLTGAMLFLAGVNVGAVIGLIGR